MSHDSQLMQFLQLLFNPYGRRRQRPTSTGIRLAQLHTETELRALFRSPQQRAALQGERSPRRQPTSSNASTSRQQSLGLDGIPGSSKASTAASNKATPPATPPATPTASSTVTPTATPVAAAEATPVASPVATPDATGTAAILAEKAGNTEALHPKDLQALASLCLALLNWKLPWSMSVQQCGAKCTQTHPAKDATQQLLEVCSTGTVICELINALVPGTLDKRAVHHLPALTAQASISPMHSTLTPIQLHTTEQQCESAAAAAVAAQPMLVPTLDMQLSHEVSSLPPNTFQGRKLSGFQEFAERLESDWFTTTAVSQAAAGTPHVELLRSQSLPASLAQLEAETLQAGNMSPVQAVDDMTAGAALDAVVPDTNPAQQPSKQDGSHGAACQMSPDMHNRLLLCNWQLAVGSAQAMGCSLQRITATQLSQGQAEPIIGFVLQLVAAHYLKDVCLERSPKLQQLQQPGESDADLLCIPAHQWVVRWVNDCKQQANASQQHCDTAAPPSAVTCPPSGMQPRNAASSRHSKQPASTSAQATSAPRKLAMQLQIPDAEIADDGQQEEERKVVHVRQRQLGGQWLADGLAMSLSELHTLLSTCVASLQQTDVHTPALESGMGCADADQSPSDATQPDMAATSSRPAAPDLASDMQSPFASAMLSGVVGSQGSAAEGNTVSSEDLKQAQDIIHMAMQLMGPNHLPHLQPEWLIHGGQVARTFLLLLVMHGQYCTAASTASSPAHDSPSDSNGPAGRLANRRQRSRNGRVRRASEDWSSGSSRSSGSGSGEVGRAGRPRRPSAGAEAGEQAGASGPLEGVLSEQEEKLLLAWLNALLSERSYRVSGLFCAAMRTGYPLLLACDVMSPGVVNWSRAFTPPYSKQRVPRKLMAVENGNQVCRICKTWNLHVVNIGGIDIAEGHQSAIMSLVWQLMRHHMVMLLHALQGPPGSPPSAWSNPASPRLLTSSMSLGRHHASSSANGALPSPRSAEAGFHTSPRTFSRTVTGIGAGAVFQAQRAFLPPQLPLPPRNSSSGSGAGAQQGVRDAAIQPDSKVTYTAGNSSTARLPRQQQIEEEVLRWANAKLQRSAAPEMCNALGASASPAASSTLTVAGSMPLRISGLQDPCLSNGKVLLALMDTMCPGAVNPAHVLAGELPFEKEQNARYVLSVARSLGCQHVHMLWEDIVAVRPRPMLMLLASLMAQDKHGSLSDKPDAEEQA